MISHTRLLEPEMDRESYSGASTVMTPQEGGNIDANHVDAWGRDTGEEEDEADAQANVGKLVDRQESKAWCKIGQRQLANLSVANGADLLESRQAAETTRVNQSNSIVSTSQDHQSVWDVAVCHQVDQRGSINGKVIQVICREVVDEAPTPYKHG